MGEPQGTASKLDKVLLERVGNDKPVIELDRIPVSKPPKPVDSDEYEEEEKPPPKPEEAPGSFVTVMYVS